MPENKNDIAVLRELATAYMDNAAAPLQEERRALWTSHHVLKETRTPVLVTYGAHNVWCHEVFGDDAMTCRDPFYRQYERRLREALFHTTIGDDVILEPWITVRAEHERYWGTLWGVEQTCIAPGEEGGANKEVAPIKEWEDMKSLSAPPHHIDEEKTASNVARLQEAVGDIIEINRDRNPACLGFMADISTDLAKLRGLEQIMLDMYESPDKLHELLTFMRDGILANQDAAEQAGDCSLTGSANQSMPYAEGMAPPKANSGPRNRKELWCHCSAQEFTLISPDMHDEFMLQYQLPIMANFGLVAYGCCENLTRKIDMLRTIPNLRIIAVAPTADVAACAEQIGGDYIFSWRPNPADHVCCRFDEGYIRRAIRDGLAAAKGCHVQIHLKDVETVEGDPTRLKRWVNVVRSVADN